MTTLARGIGAYLVTDHDGVARQAPDGICVVIGDDWERAVLQDAGAETTDLALLSMQTDHGAFLVTQLLQAQFDVETVVVVLNDPQHRPAFESVGSDVLLVERGVSFEDSLLGGSVDRIRKQTDCESLLTHSPSERWRRSRWSRPTARTTR